MRRFITILITSVCIQAILCLAAIISIAIEAPDVSGENAKGTPDVIASISSVMNIDSGEARSTQSAAKDIKQTSTKNTRASKTSVTLTTTWNPTQSLN